MNPYMKTKVEITKHTFRLREVVGWFFFSILMQLITSRNCMRTYKMIPNSQIMIQSTFCEVFCTCYNKSCLYHN